ncbi:MAG: hypothetical protein IKE24_01095 [Clostridia bacterium]|nr:hypothetical protein [Clostridia bacterium]
MKKIIAAVLAIMMTLTVSLAFAKIVEPDGSDLEHFAGKTIHASVGNYNADDKTFTVTVYDNDRYDDDDVEKLAVGDMVVAGGYLYTITGEQDVDGTRIFLCDVGEEIYFEKAYDNDDDLICRSTFDDRIFMNVVTVLHLPVAEDIVYEDNSDPDLDAKPVIARGLDAILKAQAEKEENSIGFDYYATTVTINENMEMVKIHQDFDVSQ